MQFNSRLNTVSEYHFQKLDSLKKDFIKSGKSFTDLSIGDPDLSVDKSIISGLINGFNVKDYNRYPPYDGIEELKLSIIKYYDDVYSVKLNIDEVLILIGSKEGINNIIPAVCSIGDYAIIPKPSYPVYSTCCHLWGVNTIDVALKEQNLYLPDLEDLKDKLNSKCKLFVLNYPNNPTGATANESFYEEIIEFCNRFNIVLYNDAAYSEIIRPYANPLSILQLDKKKQCIEFGTFSKIYNMTGFRIAYAVGNAKVLKALLKVKSNVDSGQFIPIQYAAIEALKLPRDYVNNIRKIYYDRKQAAENILINHNIEFFKSDGTFYIWCKTPKEYTTEQFCEELLNTYGLVVTPGIAFGNEGINNFRVSLTKDTHKIVDSLNGLKKY